jgi:hypothetical protein
MSFDLVGNTITIEQGSTFSLSLNWTNSSDETIDLTSYSARMKGRADNESTTEIFSLTEASEITLASSDPNVVITIPAATTANYDAPLLGVYDLELVSSGGVVTKILKGRLRIDREVTR